jgi:hypothetical protein
MAAPHDLPHHRAVHRSGQSLQCAVLHQRRSVWRCGKADTLRMKVQPSSEHSSWRRQEASLPTRTWPMRRHEGWNFSPYESCYQALERSCIRFARALSVGCKPARQRRSLNDRGRANEVPISPGGDANFRLAWRRTVAPLRGRVRADARVRWRQRVRAPSHRYRNRQRPHARPLLGLRAGRSACCAPECDLSPTIGFSASTPPGRNPSIRLRKARYPREVARKRSRS